MKNAVSVATRMMSIKDTSSNFFKAIPFFQGCFVIRQYSTNRRASQAFSGEKVFLGVVLSQKRSSTGTKCQFGRRGDSADLWSGIARLSNECRIVSAAGHKAPPYRGEGNAAQNRPSAEVKRTDSKPSPVGNGVQCRKRQMTDEVSRMKHHAVSAAVQRTCRATSRSASQDSSASKSPCG